MKEVALVVVGVGWTLILGGRGGGGGGESLFLRDPLQDDVVIVLWL